jgi:hypothetical protein
MRARPLATAAVGATLLLGLTGCEKPTPGVTVSSGKRSVHIESTTFCREGQSIADNDCVTHPDRSALIRVKAGEQVGIDVDKSIAEHGWVLVATASNETSPVQDAHHFSFTPQFNQGPIFDLEVRSLDRVADDARPTGFWRIRLVQD